MASPPNIGTNTPFASTSASASASLSSPNAIPPRTSSNSNASHHHTASAAARRNSATSPTLAPKSVLRPVAESDWLAQSQGTPAAATAAAPTGTAPPATLPALIAPAADRVDGFVPDGSSLGLTATIASPARMMNHQLDGTGSTGDGTSHVLGHNGATPPLPDPGRYATEDLDFTAKKTWTADKEKVVRGPYDYVSSHPGKDFRAQLIASFNALIGVPPRSLDVITRVVGMLHEASLLVDDVQDSSELRRGFPVAHNIFGVAQTINAANYIYFAALQELQRLGNPALERIFADELVYLHRGQGMDLFWRDTLTCPSEEDYLEMVGNKTGGLFRLGIKLMQAEAATPSPEGASKGVAPESAPSGSVPSDRVPPENTPPEGVPSKPAGPPVDCVPLVNLIGLIFQIRDDYLNLHSADYLHNKGMCEDLTEGKFSFPVIHAIRSDPSNLQLINILKQKTTDVQVKRYAVAYMESTGSFDYTRRVLAVLTDRARRLIAEVDAGHGRAKGVSKILEKIVTD